MLMSLQWRLGARELDRMTRDLLPALNALERRGPLTLTPMHGPCMIHA